MLKVDSGQVRCHKMVLRIAQVRCLFLAGPYGALAPWSYLAGLAHNLRPFRCYRPVPTHDINNALSGVLERGYVYHAYATIALTCAASPVWFDASAPELI